MSSRRQRQDYLGLSISQMNMIIIGGDWLIQRHHFGVDQQMMMAGEFLGDAGGGHAHLFQPYLHREALGYPSAVERRVKIDHGPRGGRGGLRPHRRDALATTAAQDRRVGVNALGTAWIDEIDGSIRRRRPAAIRWRSSLRSLLRRRVRDMDTNDLGEDRRIVRKMFVVSQQQLQ